MIEETDTRVRNATGGHPKMRAPASIFWTVSQSQDQPTSAGTMRAAILIHPEAARRAITIFWGLIGLDRQKAQDVADDKIDRLLLSVTES